MRMWTNKDIFDLILGKAQSPDIHQVPTVMISQLLNAIGCFREKERG